MHRLALASCLLLLVGCDKLGLTSSSSTAQPESKSSSPKSSSSSAADSGAKGPVFKAKMMGMDMSKPIVATSLEKAEMPGYTIQAPEGAEVEVGRPGGGAHVVAAGVNYSIAIREGTFDPAESKKTFGIIDPDGKVLSESPDLVIYQRKSGSVLFGMLVKVGDKSFHCGSLATAVDFDRETIDQTVASCRTLKSTGAAPTTSASPTAAASAAPATPAGAKAATPPAPPKSPAASAKCVCAASDLLCNMKCGKKK